LSEVKRRAEVSEETVLTGANGATENERRPFDASVKPGFARFSSIE